MFRKGLDFIKEPYRTVIQNLLNSLIRLYSGNLTSLIIYGSVARGNPRIDSDIDMLVIFEELPKPMSDRIKMFERAEDEIQPLLDELLDRGYAITLSPLIKTREEAMRFSPLYLDMTEDAVIIYDRDGFFEGVLMRVINRLRELGAMRIWVSDKAWYWVLKKDYKFSEVIEIE